MTNPHDYLFLLAGKGRARLVRHSLVDGGYVTTWRSSAGAKDVAHEIVVEADAQIIDCRLAGLVIVAPPRELAQLRERLEHDVVIIGTVEADLVDREESLLGPELDPVRNGLDGER